jgi:ABC-type dipeptide/oligopeptide/nickel transport system permease component
VLRYTIRRVLAIALTLLGMTLIAFVLTQLVGGDPARAAAGPEANAETIQRIRIEMGLDKPVVAQYIIYMSGLFHGDLGQSIATGRPVLLDLSKKLPASAELALFSVLIWLPLGIAVGVGCALRAGTWADLANRMLSTAGVSMPVFWLALLVQLFLGRILPLAGRLDVTMTIPHHTGFYLIDSLLVGSPAAFWSALTHVILPALTLSISAVARVGRMTRSCMLEVLNQEYVRTARAKGLRERIVIFRHAFRNALIPITTIVGMQIGDLIAWAFLVETVFAWPGIGRYGVSAIVNLDHPAIIGMVLVTSLIYATLNLIVDLLHFAENPRLRY